MTGKDKNYSKVLVAMKRNGSLQILSILNRELGRSRYLAGDDYSIADMSVFAYVHRADEVGIGLDSYANVVRWIGEIQTQLGFIGEVYPYSIDLFSGRELP
ncbi:MAG: glutathione S-transferase [Gammaproteobacteria bacterium]|jgi:glutathione S-transferase